MPRAKIAITLDVEMLRQVDALVARELFASRSGAIQQAVQEKLERLARSRLARECVRLDPCFQQALAEEGMSSELAPWPEC